MHYHVPQWAAALTNSSGSVSSLLRCVISLNWLPQYTTTGRLCVNWPQHQPIVVWKKTLVLVNQEVNGL